MNDSRPTLPLITERLVLRNYRNDDVEGWYRLYSTEETHRYNQTVPVVEMKSAIDRVSRLAAQADNPDRDRYTLAICLDKEKCYIGSISLSLFDDLDEGMAEMSCCIMPDHWGRGYAVEATRAMLEFGFSQPGMHRIETGCAAGNTASCRALEKSGFIIEGRKRSDMQIAPDVWDDEIIFGILDTDARVSVLIDAAE